MLKLTLFGAKCTQHNNNYYYNYCYYYKEKNGKRRVHSKGTNPVVDVDPRCIIKIADERNGYENRNYAFKCE